MGVTDVFNNNANLTGFSKTFLMVSGTIHKSFVEVSEEGTEASASTVLTATRFGLEGFQCNRPFLFLIMDKLTKNLLFMGAYKDPIV